MKAKRKARVGLWLIGAGGGIGGMVALGLAALAKGLVKTTGLVTAQPPFDTIGLIEPDRIVLGGHEIRSASLIDSARSMHRDSGVVSRELIDQCAPRLRAMQRNVRPGIIVGSRRQVASMAAKAWVRSPATGASAVALVRKDLDAFRRDHRLDHVVVVNVASSEPVARPLPAHGDFAMLSRALKRRGNCVLPSSSLYALGAISADCSYINFTPSTGTRIKAIEQFAADRKVLYMGRDGKTGETLLKSVLAPMFVTRNLAVRSWVGHNMLGNRDGQVLADPDVKESKLRTKNGVLSTIVGPEAATRTTIEYLPSLADWKVAWDYVHFEGFMGTKMSLQFTWTGSDSILAAPLVIDLARLTAWEHARGRDGRMTHLACFFKDPDGVGEHCYFDQWRRLIDHVAPSTSKS